jgi:DNA-binding transcriptional MerR regulator
MTESITPHYTIEALAEQLGVSRQLLRFWEDEFGIARAEKTAPFTTDEADQLRVVHHLLKERGFTLEEARQSIERDAASILSRLRALEMLQKLHSQLTVLRQQL